MIPAHRLAFEITLENKVINTDTTEVTMPDRNTRLSVFVGDFEGTVKVTLSGDSQPVTRKRLFEVCVELAAQIVLSNRPIGCTDNARIEVIFPIDDEPGDERDLPPASPLLENV